MSAGTLARLAYFTTAQTSMKKLFLAFALLTCFAMSALGQSSPPLRVKEADGSPNVSGVTTIVVSNGSITSVQGKTIYLTTGGGGGGGSPGGSSTQVQYNAAGSFGGISGFTSDGTNVTAGSGNLRATRPRFITSIDDTNGNEVFVITATGSAVNEVTIANAATGNNPTFTASGSDANVGINFVPKGSGTIQVSGAAIVTVSATQTLTNKTLTTPVIAQISNTGTLTLPTSTDTLVGRATTDTLTNKTLSTSNTVSASLTWTAGVKQTFAPNATTAGLNVGSVAGDPSTPSNGDLWYDSTANELTARINGANVALGSGGGSGANPTASVGLTAVNGVATTFMRSDAAPALNQAITPTWTGAHAFSNTITQTSNSATAFQSGPNGGTNPVFRLVNSTASQATGVSITGNAAGSGALISTLSSNATENLTIQAKGSGAAVILGTTTAGAQVVHFGSTAGSSIYSTTASGGDINFRSANSTFTFQGASGSTFPLSSGWIELSGAARLFGPSAGVLRLGANGSTTAAGNLIIGTSSGAIGTSGAGVLAFTLSTEPSTGPTDTTQLYYKDFAAGDGRLYLRNEASAAGSPVANLGDAQTFTGRITFSPGGTIAGINVGSLAGDPSTPSNGDLWYDSSSNELTARINGANVALGSGGGSGITVGTTTITSGTNTRVLYNNSGVVGEYTITGTGNVVMSAAPTLTGRVSAADGLFATTVTTGTGATAGLQVTANSLTTGNGAEISSSSVSSGNVVSIAATGTAAASNSKHALLVATSGANATSTQTTYGAEITNTSTGTSSTNIALSLSASGGTNNVALSVGSGQVLLPTGSRTAPAISNTGNTNTGYYFLAGAPTISQSAIDSIYFGGNDIRVNGQATLGWGNGTGSSMQGATDLLLRRNAAANLAFGAADAASPVAQTLSVQNVVGGTSNTAGVNWTFAASRGTGTGAGGDIIFQTAPAGGSGTTQNTLATAFTIQDNGAVQLKSVTFANLPTVANGYLIYCSDCTIASPCASGGSGALAKGINSAWVCN